MRTVVTKTITSAGEVVNIIQMPLSSTLKSVDISVGCYHDTKAIGEGAITVNGAKQKIAARINVFQKQLSVEPGTNHEVECNLDIDRNRQISAWYRDLTAGGAGVVYPYTVRFYFEWL